MRARHPNCCWTGATFFWLRIAADLMDPAAAAEALDGVAELAVEMHAPRRAATLLGAAARLRDEVGLALFVVEARDHKRVTAAARAAFGDAAFDQAWREGRAMGLEGAMRYALKVRVRLTGRPQV